MAIEDFNGAVAVITGGASGIGLATARALHDPSRTARPARALRPHTCGDPADACDRPAGQ